MIGKLRVKSGAQVKGTILRNYQFMLEGYSKEEKPHHKGNYLVFKGILVVSWGFPHPKDPAKEHKNK